MKSAMYKLLQSLRASRNRAAGLLIKNAVEKLDEDIPCFVICYNNRAYISQMVKQLNKLGVTPIILDNASNCSATVALLRGYRPEEAIVVRFNRNFGHKVGFLPGIYEALPNVFAYTDPDLQFDHALPSSFLQTLADLTDEYRVFKAGLALTISLPGLDESARIVSKKKRSIPFERDYSIHEWESQNWRFRVHRDDQLEIYRARLDTTFAVYNKKHYSGDFLDGVRVAGAFGAIHLPWYSKLDPMSVEERQQYGIGNKSSTWAGKPG